MQTLAKTVEEKHLIPKSFLQSGFDLKITDTISCKHPTISEVLAIDEENLGLHSEEQYYAMVNLFLTDPYSYMVYLDDLGIDYEKSNSFEVFVLLYNDYISKIKELSSACNEKQLNFLIHNNIYSKAFKFFFGIESFFIAKDENGNDVVAYGNNEFLFDKDTYPYIEEFIKRINGIPDIDKIYPEDEMSKQILLEDERDKIKRKMKHKDEKDEKNIDRFGNLLSNITWVSNGSITPFNRQNLHLFDLIDGFKKTDKLLNYKNTMTGLYSGCIEKKKINMNEIHWSN